MNIPVYGIYVYVYPFCNLCRLTFIYYYKSHAKMDPLLDIVCVHEDSNNDEANRVRVVEKKLDYFFSFDYMFQWCK